MAEYFVGDISKYKTFDFSTVVESPEEIQKQILGKELLEFIINTKEDAYCNEIEEIYLDFQGKEMRIFINDDGNLEVYTD